MNITTEQIFATKKELQQQIEEFEKKLQQIISRQAQLKNAEELAGAILEYDQIEREIEDRSRIFSLLTEPPESLTDPLIKSQLFSYFEAAETVGPNLVDFLVNDFLTQIRTQFNSGEDNTVDLIQAEFKEYVLPAKIMAAKFAEIDGLLMEMNNYCRRVDAHYDQGQAEQVLKYALERAIDADIRIDPVVNALRHHKFQFLTKEDRALLLDRVEERLAVMRFENAKKQQIAMAKAVKMLDQREKK